MAALLTYFFINDNAYCNDKKRRCLLLAIDNFPTTKTKNKEIFSPVSFVEALV